MSIWQGRSDAILSVLWPLSRAELHNNAALLLRGTIGIPLVNSYLSLQGV